MNPQAIMTPGGIADQFTRGLSGVAQAFAQRSAIDREAQRDAFSQQRALENDSMAREAFARQGDWRAQDEAQQASAFALQKEQEARAADAFNYNRQIQNTDLMSKGITPPGRDLVTPLNPTERSAVMAFDRGQEKIARDEAAVRAKNFGTAFGGAAKSAFNTDARDRTSYINSLYDDREKLISALSNPDSRSALISENTLGVYESRLSEVNNAIAETTGKRPLGAMTFPKTAPLPQGVNMPGSGQTTPNPNILDTLKALNNQQPR